MPDVPPTNEYAPTDDRGLEVMEIGVGQARRWKGWVGWGLLVLAVASLLVYLFVRFTGSMRLAVILVAFMMTYMGVMGWIASSKADRRD